MSSSASNHNPSSKCDDDESETTSSSRSSKSSHSTKNNENDVTQQIGPLLTETALRIHGFHNAPMTTQDRIEYWDIADEFSDLENDFDDATYFSKPIRSERVNIY